MSKLALSGLLAEREAMLELMNDLSEDEWNAPSAEEGKRVRDIVAHIGFTHRLVTETAKLPEGIDPLVLRGNWDIDAVIEEFDRFTEASAAVFGRMQAISRPRDMGDFGSHPTSELPDLYLFDMYGHLRGDLLEPYGPIERAEPERDDVRLIPVVQWMLAAQPQMCPVDAPITLALEGPAGGEFALGPQNGGPVATARCTDHEFVLWGTQRRPWREFVTIEGDEPAAARTLDAIRVI
jgi:mycothiol maleylpyruvate isomerase-like protein